MQIGVVQMPNTVATQVTNIQMKISECEGSTRENSLKKEGERLSSSSPYFRQ